MAVTVFGSQPSCWCRSLTDHRAPILFPIGPVTLLLQADRVLAEDLSGCLFVAG